MSDSQIYVLQELISSLIKSFTLHKKIPLYKKFDKSIINEKQTVKIAKLIQNGYTT